MRRTRGAPLLLAVAVAFGAVGAACEGDETVVEDEENGGTVEEGDDGNGGEDTGDDTGGDTGDGGDDTGGDGGDDSDLDVDVG